jgi:hypothetical protein
MPPKNYITFVNGDITITIGIYCYKEHLEEEGFKVLAYVVINPLDFKIKQ